jgi:hypothetical protein
VAEAAQVALQRSDAERERLRAAAAAAASTLERTAAALAVAQATVNKYEAELVAPLAGYLQRHHGSAGGGGKGKGKGGGGAAVHGFAAPPTPSGDGAQLTEGLRALLRSASEAMGVAEAAADTEARLRAREREVGQLKEALARVERLYTGGGAGSSSSASDLDGDGALGLSARVGGSDGWSWGRIGVPELDSRRPSSSSGGGPWTRLKVVRDAFDASMDVSFYARMTHWSETEAAAAGRAVGGRGVRGRRRACRAPRGAEGGGAALCEAGEELGHVARRGTRGGEDRPRAAGGGGGAAGGGARSRQGAGHPPVVRRSSLLPG